MTRKHFEALAAALKESKPMEPAYAHPRDLYEYDHSQYREALAQWRADVRAITLVCHAYNYQFSTRRFYAACGYRTDEDIAVGRHGQQLPPA